MTQNTTVESLSQSILVICITVQTNNGAQSDQTAFDELPRGGLRRTTVQSTRVYIKYASSSMNV